MKRFFTLFLIFILNAGYVSADEGMWLLMLLDKNIETMQKMGLKLDVEDIYHVNKSSLKDAIIQFGGGCTGEIISENGLVLTNHHCGYGQIQSHSTVEHDYLTNGFWANNYKEELKNPGLTAKFLVRMDDVSDRILKLLNDKQTEQERQKIIDNEIKLIKDEVTKGTEYTADVKPFFDGNAFYVFVYEIYKDVRLVGAPPSAIGKFGADTDNWTWPRHTGDFALFRIYMSPDGKPAEYSEDNIPFKPKHHLPISLSGVKKDDFVMILGYPGSTDRYLTSYGVQNNIKYKNPTIVEVREKKLAVMREFMNKDDAVRIQYATKYAQTSNYWKYFIGQTQQLKNNRVFEKKMILENDLKSWIEADPARVEKYGKALSQIEEAYNHMNEYEVALWYYLEAVIRGPEVILMSYRYNALTNAIKEKRGDEIINNIAKNLKSQLDKHFKDYYVEIDKKMMAELIMMFNKNVHSTLVPKEILKLKNQPANRVYAFVDKLYKKTIFTDKEKIEKALDNPKLSTFAKDPIFVLSTSLLNSYFQFLDIYNEKEEMLSMGKRNFAAALLEKDPKKTVYPNANSTMRLTYGQVLDYEPRNAVHYNYYTTFKGILEKEDPTKYEFIVPEKQKELLTTKSFGQYANAYGGELHINFISNNDITGGNSGSPVINGKGELVGLAFDGNWEAMSGDISFEPKLQRTISVDILYVLYIIDQYAGAKHIINELTLVK